MPNKYLDSDGLAEYTSLVKTALNTKAPLNSPALTGTPTAPTASAGTDTTQIATTEFVQDAIDSEETRADGAYVPLAGGTITGNLSVNGTITGNVTGNASTATNATNDANGNPIASTYLPLAGGTLTGAVNGVTPTAGDDSTKLATTAYVREEVRQHSGIPVGHIYFSVNPNIPQGSLPLFGGEFSRETYSDLWAWVQQQAGYCKTEAEWQALATNNNNNVPYYSDGDGSTTFRVPSLRCWVKGADGTVVEVGSYLEAGLPNITGNFNPMAEGSTTTNGSFYSISSTQTGWGTTTGLDSDNCLVGFDASRSSSIYGNSTTVQPESIVGMWLVKAYGTIVDTGQIDEQQYIDDRIAALPNTFLPLAGGTMTGDISHDAQGNSFFIKEQQTDQAVCILGGGLWSNGASLYLRGKDYNSAGGEFSLEAHDGITNKKLVGKPDGTLTWAGNSVITSGGGTMYGSIATNIADIIKRAADNGTVRIDGGSGYGKGACFYAAGKDYEGTGAGGHFIIEANNGTIQCQLIGRPNGTLTWNGFNLGVTAVSSNYIRYDNGLQICWGHTANKTVNGTNSTSQVVTFPVAFKNSDYSVSVTSRYVSGSWTNNTTVINSNTTTSVELFLQNVTGSAYSFYFVWMAVGSWK